MTHGVTLRENVIIMLSHHVFLSPAIKITSMKKHNLFQGSIYTNELTTL